MRRTIALLPALGALAVPAATGAQSAGHAPTCPVQRWHLGASDWARGAATDPADESLTTRAHGAGCHSLAFGRWLRIMNLAFMHYPHNGSFSGRGISGTWTLTRTVKVPDTCEGDGPGSSMSTPYGWFRLHVFDTDHRLLDTGTAKLRLAC